MFTIQTRQINVDKAVVKIKKYNSSSTYGLCSIFYSLLIACHYIYIYIYIYIRKRVCQIFMSSMVTDLFQVNYIFEDLEIKLITHSIL